MDYIKLKARAKINIALDALKKREDGYHDLRMIMQSVNLYDTIFIKKQSQGIALKTNLYWLPSDNRNLVYRAAELLKNKYNITEGIYIELQKDIPVSAGLAGGSSDCAATLIGIRKLYNLPITNEELMSIGKELGADVPYCIMRGTALAEGIGDKLTSLPPFPKAYVLLAKPPVSVSTAAVFGALDLDKINKHPDTEQIIEYIKQEDLNGICQTMHNVLECVTIPLCPIISDIKNEMLKCGALGSMMSGSGPTVFGLFEDYDTAVAALKHIKKTLKLKDVHLTTVYNPTS